MQPPEGFGASEDSENPKQQPAHLSSETADSKDLPSKADFSLQTVANSVVPEAFAQPLQAEAVIGPYRLLHRLGAGGMGEVWVAQQERPVRRQVALKLIQAGLNSQEILWRFESERQALALMNHPNVARILDAGTSASGQPYFVMELIQGETITRYCDNQKLGIAERLSLFAQVCDGVQHAHQKGVIHRDLKPGNILVCHEEGAPVPKVIDFGLAKAVDASQRLTDESLITEFGQVLGTLRYMSPEQTRLDAVDIDTRTDVYALGIILYELLTGSTPLDEKSFRSRALLDVLNLIRDFDPPKPSDRLAKQQQKSVTSITNLRQTDSLRLRRMLLGDLDWIVMKALEKDRERRYDSPGGLAADIQRYLHHEPVKARPPSVHYRIAKFVRKNRLGVTLAAMLLLSLFAGLIGTTVGLLRAYEQQSIAQRELIEKEQERAKANRNLELARKGNEILQSIFKKLTPDAQYATVAELRNALRNGLLEANKNLDELAKDEPLEMVGTQQALGVSMYQLGLPEDAIGIFEKVYETWKKQLGTDDVRSLSALNDLAMSYRDAGEMEDALRIMEIVSEKQKKILGDHHTETITGMHNLALVYQALGRYNEAIPLFLESWRLSKEVLGEDDLDTVSGLNSLALCYQEAGDSNLAMKHFQDVFAWCQNHLEPTHTFYLTCINNLALNYHYMGQVDKALPFYEESYRIRESIYGKDNSITLTALGNLAAGFQDSGQIKKAIELWIQVYDQALKLHDPTHPDAITYQQSLAYCYFLDRQFSESQSHWEDALQQCKGELSDSHSIRLRCLSGLTTVNLAQGKVDAAIEYGKEALSKSESTLPEGHPTILSNLTNLSGCFKAKGQLDNAIEYAERAAKGIEALEFQSNIAPKIITHAISCYEESLQHETADAWREKWLSFIKSSKGESSTAYAGELTNFGKSMVRRKNWEGAEARFRSALGLWLTIEPESWNRFDLELQLGYVLLQRNLDSEAESLLASGLAGLSSLQSDMPPTARKHLWDIFNQLIDQMEKSGRTEKLDEYRKLLSELEVDVP